MFPCFITGCKAAEGAYLRVKLLSVPGHIRHAKPEIEWLALWGSLHFYKTDVTEPGSVDRAPNPGP